MVRMLHGGCEHAMAYAREIFIYLNIASSVSTIFLDGEVSPG